MSTVDLVLLGMLYREAHSAYDLQKMVEFRNLSDWVRVSAPSVYKKILVLEKKGYVVGNAVREGNMPEKTVYSITAEGKKYFSGLMKEAASAPVPALFDFNAVVANLSRLTPRDAAARLGEIRAGIMKSRAHVAEHVPLRQDIPISGRAIMDQQLRVYDALIGWLDEYEKLLADNRR